MTRGHVGPEDDAEAMEVVMIVIHDRSDMIPETLNPEALLQAAIVTDNDDGSTEFAFAIRTWLSSWDTIDPFE